MIFAKMYSLKKMPERCYDCPLEMYDSDLNCGWCTGLRNHSYIEDAYSTKRLDNCPLIEIDCKRKEA